MKLELSFKKDHHEYDEYECHIVADKNFGGCCINIRVDNQSINLTFEELEEIFLKARECRAAIQSMKEIR